MTSRKMIDYYRRCSRLCDRLCSVTACWKASELTDVEYTAAERVQLNKAAEFLEEAKKLFSEVWSTRIGDQVTYEVRIGK